MYFNPMSRRYFLRGLGRSLALPFLPSVMSRAYGATGPSVRYFQLINAFGISGPTFHTNSSASASGGGSGVHGIPLGSLNGDYSTIIGSEFSPFKNKFSVIRGLHVACASDQHNTSMGTCASGRNPSVANDSERTQPVFPYSVDAVLAEASKIYPDATNKQRHVNFCPADIKYKNFSWTKKNGQAQQLPYTSETAGLLAKFAPLSGPQVKPSDPAVQRKVAVMQDVYQDYKSLRDNPMLGKDDKNRLEAYMALIQQIQNGLGVAAPTCKSSQMESESNIDAKTRNQINVVIAAMACQLTRVASLTMSTTYDPVHHASHHGIESIRTESLKKHASYVRYAMSQMDSINDGNGTLLDNSIVFWGNEFGETEGSPHRVKNMPVFLAGGAAGALQMGYYLDYRATGGMPYNNFLVTLFNAMGLSSSEYERDGVVGFGEYNSSLIQSYGFDKYMGTAERRRPLPFLYRGAQLG